MPATTFAVPILAGKTDAWKKALEAMKGPRKAEYEESRRRMGVTREVVSLQSTPQGDVVVVFIEAADPGSIIARYLSSEAPFDRWFTKTVLEDVHGIRVAPPANETSIDWSA